MTNATNLGFPRMGRHRELKKALESYWAGKAPASHLQGTAREIRRAHWELQRKAGLDLVPCNDFSLYDHVLDAAVARRGPMTTAWTGYAQSLTPRPVKGMLTGPVTILQWSFVRDDQPRKDTCWQIAMAIRDEVADLEGGGTGVIQIDEPALREGLPLRGAEWAAYLRWAVDAFRLAAGGARNETQIHTHMCYCEFNDVIDSIAALDADVISIETSRSQMELLGAFADFKYPNEIGPVCENDRRQTHWPPEGPGSDGQ